MGLKLIAQGDGQITEGRCASRHGRRAFEVYLTVDVTEAEYYALAGAITEKVRITVEVEKP